MTKFSNLFRKEHENPNLPLFTLEQLEKEWKTLVIYSQEKLENDSFSANSNDDNLHPPRTDSDWISAFGLSINERIQESQLIDFPDLEISTRVNSHSENISVSWILEKCTALDHSIGPDQLMTEIFAILKRNSDLENSLISLLGYEDMDFLSSLIRHRDEILQIRQDQELQEEKLSSRKMMVVEERDHRLERDHLRSARVNLLSRKPLPLLPARNTKILELPHVYDDFSSEKLSNIAVSDTSLMLPLGTVRRETGDYEEIKLPTPSLAARISDIPLITVQELEEWVQPVYRGYKSLNTIQSVVYPTAYATNENMLVCAPTGAGKTDVALLTILAIIKRYIRAEFAFDDNELVGKFIDKSEFKVVYVAPMKALATEITAKFAKRLAPLGLSVREWTGDMQLTRHEVQNTSVLVTTPEKFDVVSRKSSFVIDLKIRLLILDEVHLLHDDRGSVLEAVVARILRLVESSQSMIRIVGLSATLPNYLDVAEFLRVNPSKGLFVFGSSFRPVPLEQSFIGIKGGKSNSPATSHRMDKAAFEKAIEVLEEGRQVMIFVHSRKATVNTAKTLLEMARDQGNLSLFEPDEETRSSQKYSEMLKNLQKSRNRELREIAVKGIGIHHAGMLRPDRNFSETQFANGNLKILVCTATLAWGVNLPAYHVIIKGTQVFDSEKGGFVDLSVLDVLQIFGRAGRPQFEPKGVATIITTYDRLSHYISRIASQLPIESKFNQNFIDSLNAEICSTGSVASLDEAVQWLGYTYLYVRMRKNPMVYGLNDWDPSLDPNLLQHRRSLCLLAVKQLASCQMLIFHENSQLLSPQEIGRIAAQYYISWESVEICNASIRPTSTEADILSIISSCKELDSIKIRDSEIDELHKLIELGACPCEAKYGPENEIGKKNILLQAYISRYSIEDFGLISDMNYIAQNAPRILRALFEMTLRRSWGPCVYTILSLCKSIERRMWTYEHPFLQYSIPPNSFSVAGGGSGMQKPFLPLEIMLKLQSLPESSTFVGQLRESSEKELGDLVNNFKYGKNLFSCARWFPYVEMEVRVVPITRTVLRVDIVVVRDFDWNSKVHGSVDPWWIWIEDSESTEIYSHEYVTFSSNDKEPKVLNFMVPTTDPPPSQLYVRAISDRWLGAEATYPVSIQRTILPESSSPNTDLLNLHPLSISCLKNDIFAEYFKPKFTYFNPVQTQTFHSLYHTKFNVLLGAPTGSGKTVCAELAILSAFRDTPSEKVVYIAPLKALVRERMDDWGKRMPFYLGKKVIELTGDATPDAKAINESDLIVTTPEKFDGVSRNWKTRNYVRKISLIVMDEIHLLGGDRGPTLEVIVSRMNFLGFRRSQPVRLIGLSTALSNALDLGSWLNVHPTAGYFNFRHSVRPVPLEIHIDSFSGKHYCPRMATMNKPIFNSVLNHSPDKPVLVFVSSRRQTRLTAQALIALCASNSNNPRRFLKMDPDEMEAICESQISDQSLKLSLSFGIGLHHAGLGEKDRKFSEELFIQQKIQLLIATSTVAWGVNFPAHLVIVKGTEYYDAKLKKYVDYPITDVLQMMGRAGRPQYDTSGIAHILVLDQKKSFYTKFLYEPFPVESSLHHPRHLVNHINAEIGSGVVSNINDAKEYLTWTYFFRRLRLNPSYYGLGPERAFGEGHHATVYDIGDVDIDKYCEKIVKESFSELYQSSCITQPEGINRSVSITHFGSISSYYYLSHLTIRMFLKKIGEKTSYRGLLGILSSAIEYEEFPVRHNEDLMNADLAKHLRFKSIDDDSAKIDYLSPHEKVFLLLQAHFSRYDPSMFPVADYSTDVKSVLDQAIRILEAMIDVAKELKLLDAVIHGIVLLQCLKSACWWDEDPVNVLLGSGHEISLPVILFDTSFKSSILDNLPLAKVFITQSTTEISVSVVLKRRNGSLSKDEVEAYLPYMGKKHPEGWFILLSNTETNELLAMKRIQSESKLIKFEKPQCKTISVTFKSDCYFGIDLQYKITLTG